MDNHSGDGFIHVSFKLDIFLLSCDTVEYIREKISLFEYRDLTTEQRTIVPVSRRSSAAPRYMTTPLSPSMLAQIERVMEIHNVSSQHPNLTATLSRQVAHSFSATDFPSARQCFHVDNPFTIGGRRHPSRILCHLGQGYTSAKLLAWLQPWVCKV